MKKPAILIVKFPYSSTFGGGEKHTLTIVEKLSDQYDFYLASTCAVLLKEFEARNWNARRYWMPTEPVTPKALLLLLCIWPIALVQLIRIALHYRHTYGVRTLYCLSLTEKIILTPWARLFGMRVLWIEHLQIERWLLQSPLRLLYVLWSRFATIITVVEAVRTQLIALGVPEKAVTVIYNSVHALDFTPPHTRALAENKPFHVLFVGRLAIEKGVSDLISAVASIQTTIPNISLTIAGDGPEKQALEQQVTTLNLSKTVTFAGFINDVASALHAADVLVLPSTRRETFGIIAAEALACELPVIVTTAGGVSEVVGDCGWIVPPHHPEAIARALTEIYTDYENAYKKAKNGRKRMIERFSEETMIEQYSIALRG